MSPFLRVLLQSPWWPLVFLACLITLVTLVALLRAKREHVPAVFESFAAGFGIHQRRDDSAPEQNTHPQDLDDPGAANDSIEEVR